MRYERIWLQFISSIWAIMPDKLRAIEDFLIAKRSGIDFSEDEIRARIGVTASESAEAKAAARAEVLPQAGSIAIIPLFGIISQKVSGMNDISGPGGTSTESFGRAFNSALDDPGIRAIIIDIDSPGGTVYGVPELATQIFKARGRKPIVSIANSLAASAAYWIGSAAEEMVITPSGEAGSIGVYAQHTDVSKFEEMRGIKTTLISAGKYKTEGNSYEALSDEAREEIQSHVDRYRDMFVSAVSKQRGMTVKQVISNLGDGRIFGAEKAVASGMVDKIMTFDQVIKRFSGIKAEGQLDAYHVTFTSDEKVEADPAAAYAKAVGVDEKTLIETAQAEQAEAAQKVEQPVAEKAKDTAGEGQPLTDAMVLEQNLDIEREEIELLSL
jgi:signal peptide peptidase SppA